PPALRHQLGAPARFVADVEADLVSEQLVRLGHPHPVRLTVVGFTGQVRVAHIAQMRNTVHAFSRGIRAWVSRPVMGDLGTQRHPRGRNLGTTAEYIAPK